MSLSREAAKNLKNRDAQLPGNIERNSQGFVESLHLFSRECADIVCQDWLLKADQFITVDAAVVFQTFFNSDRHLSRESVISSVNGGAHNG